MKLFTLSLALMLASASLLAQKSPSDGSTNRRGRESSVPQEWKVPAGAVMLKSDRVSVPEANDSYRTVASFTDGNPTGGKKAILPENVALKDYKVIVLFKNDAAWAAPLRENKLEVSGAFQKVLEKHNLTLTRYYGAEEKLDGLVVKFAGKDTNIQNAAKELSTIDGVQMVYLKLPK